MDSEGVRVISQEYLKSDPVNTYVLKQGEFMSQINQETRQAILSQSPRLAEIVVERQYQLYSELWPVFGKVGREKCLQDINYHLAYLTEAVGAAAPLSFTDYINWVKILFRGLKFPDEVLLTTLEFIQEALKQQLSLERQEVVWEYVEGALRQLPQSPPTLPSYFLAGAPLQGLAQEYLQLLLG